MKNKVVLCNICNSNDFIELFPAGKAQIHRIVKCNVCDLIYANPQTDNVSEVEKNYTKTDGDNNKESQTTSNNFNPDSHQYLKKQVLQLKDYSPIIDFVEEDERGVFLEVGSYAGTFLNEARKRGWEVIGIEPLEIPADYSEKKLGIKVIREYFEDTDLPDQSINVVVATHVIEHVPNPTSFVEKAHKLLEKGGKLILETPTYDSFTFKLLKHRERSIRCDGHIYFFTKKTLKKLVEDHGFKVLKHENVGRTLTLDRLFYNFGVMTGKKDFFTRLSTRLKLNKFVIGINTKDMQRIYCERI
jgi:2-polyprenyl-3-methyl-5-hydroxy-6-metoxy-1,4-benzoquinol methylase